jgi:hypothetical protein
VRAPDYATKREVHLTFGEHRDVPPTPPGYAQEKRLADEHARREPTHRASVSAGPSDCSARVANLESQALEIARATGQIVETLNDELKALQLENLELRTHCRITECAA